MSGLNAKYEKDLTALIMKYNIEPDTVDLRMIWDSALSYGENKTILEKFLITMGGDVPRAVAEKQVKDEEVNFLAQQREQEELKAKMELEKSIEEIKSKTSNDIDKHFQILNEYVDTIIKSKTVYGLLVEGEAGIGKSFGVVSRLKNAGLKHDTDWVMLNSHITPLELYEFFWKHRDKIIILDDISNLFEDETKTNLLMASLWSAVGKRFMNWQSTTTKMTAPKEFPFTGKVIILTNKVPEHLDTIKSRCFHYELGFSYSEKIKILYEIAKVNNIPMDVVDFIKNATTPAHTLNFRTLFKINEIHTSQQQNGWTELALNELRAEPVRVQFWDIINNPIYKTRKEQVAKFIEVSGFSRASFFRILSSIRVSSIREFK